MVETANGGGRLSHGVKEVLHTEGNSSPILTRAIDSNSMVKRDQVRNEDPGDDERRGQAG